MKLDLSFFKNKNILITGAGGYIGSSIAKVLAQIPCCLNLFTREKGDVRDKNIWKNLLKDVDIFFHLAGQTSLNFANNNPGADLNVNVIPVVNIIETCQKNNYSPIIIFAGTVTEVGMTGQVKTSENFQDKPISIYDINKLTAEKYLQYYSNQLGKKSVTLRLANIYGPGPKTKADRGIVNLMITKALAGDPITIYGNGNYTRDYIFIDDITNAFILAATNIEKTKGKFYVLGTGIGHTILEMVKVIQKSVYKMTGKNLEITFAPFPKGISEIEKRNFIADNSAFRSDTKWKPIVSLEEGIDKTVKYFLNKT